MFDNWENVRTMLNIIPSPEQIKKEINYTFEEFSFKYNFNQMAEKQIRMIKNAMQKKYNSTVWIGRSYGCDYKPKLYLKAKLIEKGFKFITDDRATWITWEENK